VSTKSGQEGYWVMNPDGSGRRYLGRSQKMDKEYEALREREAYSPDGRFRAYALQANGDSSVQIYWQGVNSDGYMITTRVTDFGKISYDPVWSPDGSKIAFVSTARESDDIWIANPDGKGDPQNLTANPWQWDKHPSWSPDSKQIVFWSNRDTKRKLIWVMDRDGKNVRLLSGQAKEGDVEWEEFNPLWVK
jgi:TolB protein